MSPYSNNNASVPPNFPRNHLDNGITPEPDDIISNSPEPAYLDPYYLDSYSHDFFTHRIVRGEENAPD